MKHQFIAIEGLDGAGKSTQIRCLTDYFSSKRIPTQFVHFPRSGVGEYGNLIARFLCGDFGTLNNVHPQLVALLFAQDRLDFSHTIRQWIDQGNVVLVDRYVFSNIAFQCAKSKNQKEKEQLRNWIYHFEYEYNKIPQPDLSIYLDVPFSFTHQSLNQKRSGDDRLYLEGKEDIHELDLAFQQAVKAEYDELVKTRNDIVRISCSDSENKMKSVDEIHATIISLIQ